MDKTEIMLLCTLTVVLLIAAVQDIRFKKIPNWLTLSTMIGAIVYQTSTNGFSGFLLSISGIGVGIGVFIIPYLMGGMGAGDAKLMGAVGGLLGPKGVFIAFLITAIIGGIYALIIIAFRGNIQETLLRFGIFLKSLVFTGKPLYLPPSEKEKAPRLRYAIAIGLGSLSSVFVGHDIFRFINF